MPNCTTKKEWDLATDIDISDLAALKDFIALKAEVDKLDIVKFVAVLTSCNKLEIKVGDWNVDKLKTSTVDLSNVADNEVFKN